METPLSDIETVVEQYTPAGPDDNSIGPPMWRGTPLSNPEDHQRGHYSAGDLLTDCDPPPPAMNGQRTGPAGSPSRRPRRRQATLNPSERGGGVAQLTHNAALGARADAIRSLHTATASDPTTYLRRMGQEQNAVPDMGVKDL